MSNFCTYLFLRLLRESRTIYIIYGVKSSYVPDRNKLYSQDISEFLSEIGRDELSVETFFNEWSKQHKNKSKAVMFDITSISSYGSGNEFHGTRLQS